MRISLLLFPVGVKSLFIRGTAFDGSLFPVGRRIKFSKKIVSFSKKIWQQVKAGYLCAPLLKKGIALKKRTTLYAVEKGKKFGEFIKPPTFATRSKKHLKISLSSYPECA